MAFPTPKGITKYHTSPYPAINVRRPELSAGGKVVFITGGGSGLGLVFAQHFAMAGCTTIAITGRRQNIIDDAKTSLEKEYSGLRVLALQGDVTDKQAVEAAFEATKETFGVIHVLINNAGYLPAYTALASSDPEDWWMAFETNVRGSFNVLSAFLPAAASNAVVFSKCTIQSSNK
jgi:NAD(P)-dependent dehydrogenase (short-subunit alcohol dehydrogenase family)